jgi:hypothetical protein
MPRQEICSLNGISVLADLRRRAERGIACSDPEFEKKYPCLFSILNNPMVSEDERIEPPVLSFSNSTGDWRVSLGVKSLSMYGSKMAPTFLAALEVVEADLCGGRFPWEPNWKKGTSLRKVKKQEGG